MFYTRKNKLTKNYFQVNTIIPARIKAAPSNNFGVNGSNFPPASTLTSSLLTYTATGYYSSGSLCYITLSSPSTTTVMTFSNITYHDKKIRNILEELGKEKESPTLKFLDGKYLKQIK